MPQLAAGEAIFFKNITCPQKGSFLIKYYSKIAFFNSSKGTPLAEPGPRLMPIDSPPDQSAPAPPRIKYFQKGKTNPYSLLARPLPSKEGFYCALYCKLDCRCML